VAYASYEENVQHFLLYYLLVVGYVASLYGTEMSTPKRKWQLSGSLREARMPSCCKWALCWQLLDTYKREDQGNIKGWW
jgi:hypothetical protein